MKTYCVEFLQLKGYSTDSVFGGEKVICGKSPLDAMKREFQGKKITPLYGYDNQRFTSNVIIAECIVGKYGIELLPRKKINCYKVED